MSDRILKITDAELVAVKRIIIDSEKDEALSFLKKLLNRIESEENKSVKKPF